MGNNRVCPVERAGGLESRFRRWLQNPSRILEPYIKEGMTVLDFGCGPGYFTIEMAKLVGRSGTVIAADLQEGMLKKLSAKISNTEFDERIKFIKTENNRIGLSEKIDFALAFYVLHEIPNQERFFIELESVFKPHGKILVSEPPFHVSKAAFAETVEKAIGAGFKPDKGPRVFLGKTVILKKD